MALPKIFGSGKKRKKTAFDKAAGAPRLTLADMFQSAVSGQTVIGLPGFSTSAADQPSRRDDQFAAVRMKLRSVYTPSQPVFDPRMFAGRRFELKLTIRAIEDQRLHIVVYGERGIGKTSLLHMLSSAARSARYIVIYISCGATSNFDETFHAVAAEIPLLFHREYAPTSNEAEKGLSLETLLPEGPLSPRLFGNLCGKLTGTRVLIVLDEFDRAESLQFRRNIAELIKTLSDQSARVQLVISGVASDLVELLEHAPSVRRNILAVPISFMSTDEIKELVENGARESGTTIAPVAREHIITISAGSPYVASLICHHATLDALDQGRLNVEPADVFTAIEKALTELASRLARNVLEQTNQILGGGDAKTLTMLAAASIKGGGVFDAALLEKMVGSAKAATCLSFAAYLASRDLLIARRDVGASESFAFIEDAIPTYIWFVGARENLGAENLSRAASPARPVSA